ncbi:MAG: hypothetical protein L3J39_08175 [Verrucomicrobiales bacterium]|nr:hypothetical protein [Verrucomicrobiales bacterium]
MVINLNKCLLIVIAIGFVSCRGERSQIEMPIFSANTTQALMSINLEVTGEDNLFTIISTINNELDNNNIQIQISGELDKEERDFLFTLYSHQLNTMVLPNDDKEYLGRKNAFDILVELRNGAFWYNDMIESELTSTIVLIQRRGWNK